MNMYKWLEDLRTAKVKKSMPILSFPSAQLLGVTVKELIMDYLKQAEGMKRICDRLPTLASVSLMDLSVEAECFGAEIVFSDDEVPTVVGKLVGSVEEAEQLKIPAAGDCRTAIYIKAVGEACKLIKDRPVFAGVIGSFSLAGRLVGVTEAMINCYEEPEMMKIVLEKSTRFIIDYINEFKKAGANGVVIAEPLTGMLSPALAEEFSEPYIKMIIDSCQTEDFIVIYHNCGDYAVNMISSLLKTGAKAFHFGNAVDMREVLKKIPESVVAMGNIDPAGQFKNGTPASIRAETLKLLEDCSRYDNFVISSGCDIPPSSRWENIDAYFDAIKEFYSDK